jgi:predicted transposase/invertase (TIGR01784 family)
MASSTPRHDPFARQLLRFPETARPLLETELPPDIVRQIDWASFALEETSYLDERGKQRFSDVVYGVLLQGGMPAKLTILLEHKHDQNRSAALQLMGYRQRIWEREENSGQPFSVVLPLLLYHGSTPWREKPFEEQFGTVPEAVFDEVPRFRYRLIDLQAMALEEIARRYQGVAAAMVFRLLKLAAERGEGTIVFEAIRNSFRAFQRHYQGLALFNVWLSYLSELTPSNTLFYERIEQLEAGNPSIDMSALQQMLEKAEARGRAEAQAREAQKNAAIVKRLAARSLPADEIAQIVELSAEEVRRILAEQS